MVIGQTDPEVDDGPAGAEQGDADLVEQTIAGDRLAFGELYRRHASFVNAVLLSRVPRAAAGDLLQDVFAAALERLGTLREPSAFPVWIVGIARNLAAGYHRSARTIVPVSEREAPPMVATLEANAALEALRALPETYRENVALRLIAGLTGPEIAARTGLTPGSVRVNLCRGMRLLREKLEGNDDA